MQQPVMHGGKVLPMYKSHKIVHALKINEVDVSGNTLGFEGDYEPMEMDTGWMQKHAPEAGGYFVVYADNYESYSPAKAFEEGYTPYVEPEGTERRRKGAGERLSDDEVEAVRAGGADPIAFNKLPPPIVEGGLSMEQSAKYTTNEAGQLVSRASGAPIPPDEPVFIVRAQDIYAAQTLGAYKSFVKDDDGKAVMLEVMRGFAKWQDDNRGKVKMPD